MSLSLIRATRLRVIPHFRSFASKNVLSDPSEKESKPKAFVNSMPKIELNEHQDPSVAKYTPKEKHQRVTFEYPAAPSDRNEKNASKLRWKPVMPLLVTLVGGLWGLYTFNYFVDDIPNEYLHPDKFIPFIITNKQDIDADHYLIELTPKYSKWKKNVENKPLWNGLKLWSVEIRQPQINVVRNYTPLPLEIHDSTIENDKIVTIQSEEDYKNGKFVLYIKKYNQGEVARWIYRKSIGSELELRGPYYEFEFPKSLNNNYERPKFDNLPSKVKPDPIFPIKPDNLLFFAGGTGIAPILQSLLSKNPFKGHIKIFYSTQNEIVSPFDKYLFFLEKLDRIELKRFINNQGQHLTYEQVPNPSIESNLVKHEKIFTPQPQLATKMETEKTENSQFITQHNFKSALDQALLSKSQPKEDPSLALVCGPDGYLNYVSGLKAVNGQQGPVSGLLKKKGFNEKNVFKL